MVKPIPGWPGYFATDEGVILGRRGAPLRPRVHRYTGHLRVRLYGPAAPERVEHRGAALRSGGRWADIYVHVLVALAFHGPPPTPEARLVLHANDEPQDNRPANLRWGTHQANADDRARNARERSSIDADGFDWASGTSPA